MITFRVYRPEPPETYVSTNITNQGKTADYEGVIFSDGTVCIRWLTEYRSHSIWPDFSELVQVHGHPEYGTIWEFDDPDVTMEKLLDTSRTKRI